MFGFPENVVVSLKGVYILLLIRFSKEVSPLYIVGNNDQEDFPSRRSQHWPNFLTYACLTNEQSFLIGLDCISFIISGVVGALVAQM